jgi:putative phage-type endonuclease
MQIIDIEQRTEEWFAYRLGKATGSDFKSIVGRKDATERYRYQLIAERLMGIPEGDENPMGRGTRLEPIARDLFVEKYGKSVHEAGLIQSDEFKDLAVSPDGFIGEGYEHQLEIKCLAAWKHVKTYVEKTAPEEYYPQAIAAFISNEMLKRFTFCFYHDLMPEHLKMFTIEIARGDVEADIQNYKQRVAEFLASVDAEYEKLILS